MITGTVRACISAMLVVMVISCQAERPLVDGKIDKQVAIKTEILGTSYRIPGYADNIYLFYETIDRTTQSIRFDGPSNEVLNFAKLLGSKELMKDRDGAFPSLVRRTWWTERKMNNFMGDIVKSERFIRYITVDVRGRSARIWISTMDLQGGRD